MEITKTAVPEGLLVSLKGRLDTLSAPVLEAEIAEQNPSGAVILDLAELVYVSSAGLRVLLALHKQLKNSGGLIVQNVSENVMEILDITGFTDLLTIRA